MKTINYIFILLIFQMCSKKKEIQLDGFKLEGIINGNYKGYLYLNYNDKKDSCMVVNNKFHFEGKTSSEIVYSAHFSTNRTAAMDKNFFIENEKINMEITIVNRKINTTELDWIIIDAVSGTKTSLIDKDYEEFKLKHENDSDWQSKNYRKIDEIVTQNPKSEYALQLFETIVSDSVVDIKALQDIYKKVDINSQNPSIIINIEKVLYPKKSDKIGKPMMDFELPNEKLEVINTKQFRGSILLVDFWASWCGPCRKEFPKIAKVHEKYKHKNFKILSVSIDDDKQKWLQALAKEKMQWDNVLEQNQLKSKIVKEYEVTSIPSTYLIDENGIVIANNPTIEEIENYLDKNLK